MGECSGHDDLRVHVPCAQPSGAVGWAVMWRENIPECRKPAQVTRGLANHGRLVACGPGMSAAHGVWERDNLASHSGSPAIDHSRQYLSCVEAYYDDEHHHRYPGKFPAVPV
jgi:hypothetical protein